MSFLQPWMLWVLPAIALPILIHLISRRRHRSVEWAAMMFLVKAERMNKGMARLRYVLIMLMRMLAIAAIVFVASRPLASGRFSMFGMSKPDATLILLDRSASMETRDPQTGESKRSTSLKKLGDLLEKRSHGSQLVLLDSASDEPRLLDSPQDLLELPNLGGTATSADIPDMLERSLAYLKANEAGRADLWICSDLNENDWNPDSGRWSAIREQFSEMKGVQHFLLSYAERPVGNLSIRVDNVKRRESGNRAELVLDVLVQAERQTDQSGNSLRQIPVQFEINGVRTTVDLDLDSQGASLQGHRITIDRRLRSGWGSVSVPEDSNALDNRFYFVFSEPTQRRAVIVSDDERTANAFQLALNVPMEQGVENLAEFIPSSRVSEIDWQATSLLIWQAPLPSGLVAEQIQQFVNSGRVAMFFPPGQKDDGQLFGAKWGQWQKLSEEEQRKLSWWRADADLLAHVESGDALPLNDLRTYQYCALTTAGNSETPLARLGDDRPLLVRTATDRGGVYFCSTLPTAQSSTLERDGISFYVMLQRALAVGSQSLSPASQRDAEIGVLGEADQWEAVAPTGDRPTVSEKELQAGVYRNGDAWAAINRSLAEDEIKVTDAATADALFDGLSYQRIDDSIGDSASLASEVWRLFLLVMAIALIAEAFLSMPEKQAVQQQASSFLTTENQRQEAA